MAATLDGVVEPGGAVFEVKFMLPWTFSEEAAAETAQHVGRHVALCCPFHHPPGRDMGGRGGQSRPAVPAPAAHRLEEVLALHREQGDAPAISGSSRRDPAWKRSGTSI
jgi:hypothetical protein